MTEAEKELVIKKAKDDLMFRIRNIKITSYSIILILKYAMQIVELTTLSGLEKRDAVIELVRSAVTDVSTNDDIESILLQMIDTDILSNVIDVIISATRGELHLNGVFNTSKIACSSLGSHTSTCLSKCFPCIKSTLPESLLLDR